LNKQSDAQACFEVGRKVRTDLREYLGARWWSTFRPSRAKWSAIHLTIHPLHHPFPRSWPQSAGETSGSAGTRLAPGRTGYPNRWRA